MRKVVKSFINIVLIVLIIASITVSALASGLDSFANASLNNTGDTIIFYVVIAVTAFCGLVGVLVFGGDQKKN